MQLHRPDADCHVPDGTELTAALARTTHLCIGAHQDDQEFMAYHGIEACYGRDDLWFTGVVVTDGAGSARGGPYSDHTDGDWHHVAIVWDGSRRYIYADGTEVAADPADLGESLESCDGRLYLGAHKGLSSSYFWTGMLDDTRIYNRALSPAEINALAN